MFVLKPTHQFKKDIKLAIKRSAKNADLIKDFLGKLEINGVIGLKVKHRPHKLNGNYADNWEAHIKPDLLIIWFEIVEDNEILLIRLGSHSDLFS